MLTTILLFKVLDTEVDAADVVYGMSLGAAQGDEDASGMTRSVQPNRKVNSLLSYT